MKLTTTIEVSIGELGLIAHALRRNTRHGKFAMKNPKLSSQSLTALAIETRASEILEARIVKYLAESPYIIREEPVGVIPV